MGLLTSLLTSPVSAPLKGSLWVARQIHEAAEREHNDPAMIKQELTRLERALLAGEMSEEDYDAAELTLLARLREAGP